MMQHKLNQHNVVGLDIDGTLINGPASLLLQNWVLDNFAERDVHLVTFRTGEDLDMVWKDLAEVGLFNNHFKGLHSIPLSIGQTFWKMTRLVGFRNEMFEPKWKRALKHHKVDEADYLNLEHQVQHWKGKKCAELGATVLVDDLEYFVKPGCDLHGIEFIHALNH